MAGTGQMCKIIICSHGIFSLVEKTQINIIKW